MTELKTLKDLIKGKIKPEECQGRYGSVGFVWEDELKQEAIKRIKKIREDFEKGTAGQTEDYNFMDFFNIKEKDLK